MINRRSAEISPNYIIPLYGFSLFFFTPAIPRKPQIGVYHRIKNLPEGRLEQEYELLRPLLILEDNH